MKSWIGAMKRCYLDANVLLYFSNVGSVFYQQTSHLMYRLILDKWELVISPLTLDEYFHNSIRFAAVPQKVALTRLKRSFLKITKIPGIRLIALSSELKKQSQVINLMSKYELRARDAYHLLIMRENKVKYLATFDNDFEKVFHSGIIKKFV